MYINIHKYAFYYLFETNDNTEIRDKWRNDLKLQLLHQRPQLIVLLKDSIKFEIEAADVKVVTSKRSVT